MRSIRSLMLASTALFVVATALPPAQAAVAERPLVLAQTNTPAAQQQPQQKPGQQPAKPQGQNKPAQATPRSNNQPNPQAQKPTPPNGAQPKPTAQTPAAKPPAKPATPTAQQPAKPTAPTAQHPAKPPAPTAQQPGKPPAPTAHQPGKPPAPTAQQPGKPPAPTAQQPGKPPVPTAQQSGKPPAPTAQRQPPRPHDASDFIRRDNGQPGRKLEDLRKERQETREGNRVVIREGSRTIVRENNRVIIRHSEVDRFAIGAVNVRVDHRGGNMETIVERPGGVRIINVVDANGRLLRRVRRDPSGREYVLINNVYAGPGVAVFIDLPPPVIRIPRERYIVELDRAQPAMIYDVFVAPPVERIERRYTLEQVRFSAPLRERMPRVDLDINFETGSWQILPGQMARLAVVADGLKRAIAKNPREVFLIEGYTDAVGSTDDNLSLSDRRAEAVAVALSEQFQVPTENLVTQGYGEQNLKVPTQGAEPRNRRVSVRRITPLIEQQAAR
ncbi:MAG TPA: OmpA family protein [Pseudolabrys sp.]|nr:OmpA family protein [Pseudolabrys sp.]